MIRTYDNKAMSDMYSDPVLCVANLYHFVITHFHPKLSTKLNDKFHLSIIL